MPRSGPLLLYLAALLGGTYAAFRPTFDSGFAAMQSDPGDTLLNHYVLEHTWRVVSDPGYCGTLWSPPMDYPEPGTLAYSENFLGVVPVYWLLRLGLPPDLAFQWWMIALNALNFVAFVAVARRVGLPVVLAAAGGFLWAFAVVHIEQIRHQQMIPRFWMPVAAYSLWRFVVTPSGRNLNGAVGCLFLQTTACLYTGWFLALGLGVYAGVALTLEPGGWGRAWAFAKGRRGALALILGGGGRAFGVLAIPYFVAYVDSARIYVEVAKHIPSPSAWVAGPVDSRWYHTIRPYRDGVDDEATLFSGFGVVAAAGCGLLAARALRRSAVWGEHARLAAGCVLTAAVLAAATTDWTGEGLSGWFLLRFLPGGRAIRVISRVYVCVHLYLALGGMVGIWLLVETGLRTPRAKAWAYAAAVFVLVFEQTGYDPPSFPKDTFYPQAGECAAALRGADVGYLPVGWGPIPAHGDLLAMWAGLDANMPVVNGYSGRTPPGYPTAVQLTDDELRAWLAPRFRGRVVVVEPCNPRNVRYLDIE